MLKPAVPSHAVARRRRCSENDELILDLLTQANRPLSAYDIADGLGRRGTRMVPNQVYRTLTRLIGRHDVVRIETLNAYVLRRSRANVCLICKRCHAIVFVDLPDLGRTLDRAAGGRRFALVDALIEAQGECEDCRETGEAERSTRAPAFSRHPLHSWESA